MEHIFLQLIGGMVTQYTTKTYFRQNNCQSFLLEV